MAPVRRLNLQRQAAPLVQYTIVSSIVDLTPYNKSGTNDALSPAGTVPYRFVPTAVSPTPTPSPTETPMVTNSAGSVTGSDAVLTVN